MKYLYGYFHPETGESVVVLADKYGSYIGEAKVHPNDKEHSSEFMGCGLAERRALVKMLKSERRRASIQFKTIQTLNNEIKKYNPSIPKNIQRRINLKLRDFSKQIEEIDEAIETIKTDISKRIETRDKIIEKIKKA